MGRWVLTEAVTLAPSIILAQMGGDRWSRIARILVLVAMTLALAILGFAFVRTVANAPSLAAGGGEPPLFSALWQCSLLGFLVVGSVVAFRRPQNPIGWALIVVPLSFWSSYAVAVEVAVSTAQGRPLPSWSMGLVWLLHGAFAPALLIVALFILLAFPNGDIDRVGRRLLRVAWPTMVAVVLFRLLAPGPLDATGEANPYAVAALSDAGGLVEPATMFLVLFVIVAGWNLFGRYRRSTGSERQQFRWVIRSIAVVPLAFLGASFAESQLPDGTAHFTDLAGVWIAFFGVAAGMAVSVLKYRLWDIDRLVSRTVTYTLVTVILLVTYLGLVVVLQPAIRPVAGDSDLAIALSTLGAAALFQPLRRRVQAVVDRRFNRSRYDADRMVATFGSHLRAEVDLDAVRQELLDVVGTALQPSHCSLSATPTVTLPERLGSTPTE